jgi:ribosomal protein S7
MKIKKLKITSSNLYFKMLGFLIKQGKKTKASKIITLTFLKLNYFFKKSLCYLLNKIFFSLNVFVETKILKSRRNRFIIPFPISLKRRMYLSLKWLLLTVKNNKKKHTFSKKLFKEIVALINTKNSETSKLKFKNHLLALSNRSNTHYRW